MKSPRARYKEWKKSKPTMWGKTLFTRKPKLRTADECATFALSNLSDLTFEQIAELEKAVAKHEKPFIYEGMRYSSQAADVMWIVRIVKPMENMKKLEKIEARWADAFYGRNGKGLIFLNEAWQEYTLAILERWKRHCIKKNGAS